MGRVFALGGCLGFIAGLVLGLFLGMASTASAFPPENERHHPYAPYPTPLTAKVAATSTLTWQAVDQFGWPAWREVVRESLDTDASDPLSLGRVYNDFLRSENRGQITIREAVAGESPDMRNFAVATAVVETQCGGPWATACNYITNPRPVPSYYKAANMILWGAQSQRHVVRHETNHSLARACDQYVGGCPKASTGLWPSTVACTSNPDSLMDCNNAARTATFFDYVTFRTAYPANTPFLQIVNPCVAGPTVQWPDGPATWDPCADEGRGLWVGPGDWDFSPSRLGINGSPGLWLHKQGYSEWCAFDESYGGRYNCRTGFWYVTRTVELGFDTSRPELGWHIVSF